MKLRILRRTKMAEDMRPLSMDDYTDTEFTGQKRKPLIEKLAGGPYGGRKGAPLVKNMAALVGKGLFKLIGDDDGIMDAYNISREVAENLEFKDEDATEDTLRHILLGGLVESKIGQVTISKREGNDPESKIDHNNNLYGKALREKYPDRQEFINAAIATAISVGENNSENVEKLKDISPQLSYGSKGFTGPMPLMSGEKVPTRPDNIVEPDPMKSTDDYTVTQKKGGALMAQQGMMPMRAATSAPTGGGPKNAQGAKQNTTVPKPVGRPTKPPASSDPRDIAIAEVEGELAKEKALGAPTPTQAKKGTVKIDEELKKGTKPEESTGMAVMIGLGAPDMDYQDAAEGDPPPGATKEEVADDQMVLMSEGELVVPANVVRFHGLATYEGMRREALAGLQDMESDGQISYIEPEKTKKTYQGGIMRAQAGGMPIAQAASSAYGTDYATLGGTYPGANFPIYGGPAIGMPGFPYQGYNPQPTPTYQFNPYVMPKVVAPNIGHYLPEDQRLPWMSPDELPTGPIPGPGPTPTPTPTPTPDPIPTPDLDPIPTPKLLSESAVDYITGGEGQDELSSAAKALKDAETQRDIDKMHEEGFDEKFEPYPEFTGDFSEGMKTLKGLASPETWSDAGKKIQDDVQASLRKQFGPATPLGDPFTNKTNVQDYPFANFPAAFRESIINPQKAAIRSGRYNPSKLDIAAATLGDDATDADIANYAANLTDAKAKSLGWDPKKTMSLVTGTDAQGDPIVKEFGQYQGQSMADIIAANKTYTPAGTYTRAEKSKRRGEANAKRAQDSGFASQGIKGISQEELNAQNNINKALNDGQYNPNGLMGVEQYADFKKTGLGMQEFFKLSRAEQSFYAAARTGDTVESWVIDSMKEGTTAAFDAMNAANDSNVLKDDKYKIQAAKQYKPANAKTDDYEVNVMQYWQSEEGKKKAKELGVDVG